jgi:hydrogenase maturation protein HypF
MNRVLINIKGVVQGVGFRPFIYNLAMSLDLKGYVANTAEGVVIDIEGDDITSFIDRFPKEAPPLSEIKKIDITPMPVYGYKSFEIFKSSESSGFTLISPDISICDDCLKEMFDRDNRRYLYPFINCINCGPRYTITNSVPYDRSNTTMATFKMCPECEDEYNDPKNRRFHAQPNACSTCGPHVELKIKNETDMFRTNTNENENVIPAEAGIQKAKLLDSRLKTAGMTELEVFSYQKIEEDKNPIALAIELLKQGAIIAVKGLGGFHIACDATDKEAVERLRLKKRKSNKPFAIMAPDIETIERYCVVSEEEKQILISNRRPIMLLKKRIDSISLPDPVSPNNKYLGFMLPYTPLHYLLFYYPLTEPSAISYQLSANFDALIMTSGNISEEPIVIDNDDVTSKLSEMVDAVLIHNRDIFMRTDDSVVRIKAEDKKIRRREDKKSQPLNLLTSQPLVFVRRARGYTPDPIALHDDGPEVLGCGADIKNTFTLTKGSYAIPSQHIGDMENYETLRFFEESLNNLKKVYRVNPVAIGYDLHPNYLSTKWALSQESGVRSQESGVKNSELQTPNSKLLLFGIQHHYAHVASVMAENGIKGKIIGVAFDGTGYGTDGNLWGSEFLIADMSDFKRAGHFKYVPLPGGETAIREPWRIAVSYIKNIAGDETMHYLDSIGFIERYGNDAIENILKIIDNRDFSPLSSGAGRLFDAVSAMLNICDKNTFEGEAAMALESYTIDDIDEDYPADIMFRDKIEVDFSLALFRLVEDIMCGTKKEIITTKFHNTIVSVIAGVVQKLSAVHRLHDVALSGGVFQNMYLLKNVVDRLKSIGMNVYINEKVPANDAGISLGQAYIVREWIR